MNNPSFAARRSDELELLAGRLDGARMMRAYLQERIARHLAVTERVEDERLAAPVDVESIARWQQALRRRLNSAIGGLPEARTPLNARTVAVVPRAGFRVEKVIHESSPGVYVTALLFLPDDPRFEPPYPAVLVACGHVRHGKADEASQRGSALAAHHGLAALLVDPIDQGERFHLLDDDDNPHLWSGLAHNALGVGSIPLGKNPARFIIHDLIRSLDYLQQRSDIDGDRLGVMGNSGGGTQTALLTAVDDRIKAAAPSCYITSFERLVHTLGPQDSEQNIFGQLAFGLDHAGFLTMRAPVPVMVCAATDDYFDIEGTRRSVQRTRRVFEALGHPEHLALTEATGPHGWHRPLREASVRWMTRFLRAVDEPAPEPDDLEVLTERESRVTEHGQVMRCAGAVSLFDLNARRAQQMARHAEARWAAVGTEHALGEIRELLDVDRLHELPEPELE
ncbi:MAG: alpha/beta hydrolase family protein [Phycisphaeraceae bacterium]